MKKIFIAFLALTLLAASLTACSKKKAHGYYVSFSSYAAAQTAVRFRPKEGSFDSVLCEDRAKVSALSGEGTASETKLYGMASITTGEILIPIHYIALNAFGDFLLAEGTLSDDALFVVFYKDGTRVFGSDFPLTIEDVGGGFVKIVEVDHSYVYSKAGENVLFGSLLGKDYDYVCCGNYILAKSQKTNSYFIFSAKTGEILKSFFGGNGSEPYVAYAGGNDFILVYTDLVSSTDRYKVTVASEGENLFYDQRVYRITIGMDAAHEIEPNRFIYRLHNRYDFGLSPSERENYPLKDGYFAESDYEITNKTATGVIHYVLSDASLKVIKTLPEGISPYMTMRDGYCLSNLGGSSVYLFDEDLKVVLSLPNDNYQSVKWSDGVLVAAKLENGKAFYGAFSPNGTLVLPFEYAYLSEFRSGKAIGVKNGKAYVVGIDGSESYCADDAFPFYWDGFALTQKDGKTGVISFSGETLIPAEYDSVSGVSRQGNEIYLIMAIGQVRDLFVLS